MTPYKVEFSTILAEIITILTGIFIVLPNIQSEFQNQAIYFLILISVSIYSETKYKEYEIQLQDRARNYFRKTIWFPRIISACYIFLLWTIPLLFSLFPKWITNQTKNILYSDQMVAQCYNLEIRYHDKIPDSQNELFFHLKDTTTFKKLSHSPFLGVAVQPVLEKIIGNPSNDLIIFGWIFIGITILFIFVITPLAKEIGNKTNSSGMG